MDNEQRERLKRIHDQALAELSEILTLEGMRKLDEAQDDFDRRVLYGERQPHPEPDGGRTFA